MNDGSHFPRAHVLICVALMTMMGGRLHAADEPDVWTAPAPLSPAESLKTIVVPDGFAVELVAAEPLVLDPVAFAWGPDMRLWVVEMADYNWLPINDKSDKKPKGRIVYLTDTDGDGKYDQRTVFLDNLDYPTGVLPWRKGVLVTAAPDILYAEDTTPDDASKKADKIDRLYTGFAEGNPQLRVNGLQWGLDNWIYCANGLSNGVVKSNKTGQTIDIRGRDIRIRPDTGEIEPASGPSQFGRVRDDFGNWFGVDNSRLIIHYVLEDHYLKRNPHVAAPEPFIDLVTPRNPPCYPIGKKVERLHAPYMANRFTSACGIAVYRDNYLGDDVYGQVFVCEPVHNLITRRKLRSQGHQGGVSFDASRVPGEEQREFLASSDEWFRPVHVRTGPDGALYIADMYRAVVEHPQWLPKDFNMQVDWMQGSDKGRIYRVVRKDRLVRNTLPLDWRDDSELIDALYSPNGSVRDMAHMMMTWRPRKAMIAALQGATRRDQIGELQKLAVLDAAGELDESAIAPLLDWHDSRFGETALRFFGQTTAGKSPSVLAGVLDYSSFEGWPPFALRLANALGPYGDPIAGKLLARVAAENPANRHILTAVLCAGKEHVGVLAEVRSPRGALPDDFFDGVAATAIGEGKPQAIAQVLRAIVTRLDNDEGRLAFRMTAAVLTALERKQSTLAKVRKDMDDAGKRDVDGISAVFAAARAAVEQRQPTREEAVKLIGRGEGDAKAGAAMLLGQLAQPDTAQWHLAVLSALGRLSGAWSPADLPSEVWTASSPKVRTALIEMLLRREPWPVAVIDAVEAGRLAPSALSSAQRQALLQHKTPAIRERAAKLLGSITSNRAAVLESHADVLTMAGDPARGQPLFEKTCAVCHKIAGVGKGFGPDLGALSDRSPKALLTAILDPNQAVDPRYLNYVAATTDAAGGETFTGVLLSETASGITLVGADGVKRTILRKDLSSLRSTSLSVMPEGLEQGLGKQGLADVIAFVASRSQPARVLEGVRPAVIKPAANGSLVLPATACEAYGKAITYEREDNNLGAWSVADDFVAWMIETAAGSGDGAGKYEIWLDYACDKTWAGNSATISAENDEGHAATLTVKIESTGTFNDYQQSKIGIIELAAGKQRVIIRPNAPITGRLMDLRGVRLVPVK